MEPSWSSTPGIAFFGADSPTRVTGWARAAERAGLASAWIIEDYFHPGAYALAAAAAAVTERLAIGLGVVNQKHATPEALDEVAGKIDRAIRLFGRERVLLHPDCGFATFADNPICDASAAEAKLAVIAAAAARMRERLHLH